MLAASRAETQAAREALGESQSSLTDLEAELAVALAEAQARETRDAERIATLEGALSAAQEECRHGAGQPR